MYTPIAKRKESSTSSNTSTGYVPVEQRNILNVSSSSSTFTGMAGISPVTQSSPKISLAVKGILDSLPLDMRNANSTQAIADSTTISTYNVLKWPFTSPSKPTPVRRMFEKEPVEAKVGNYNYPPIITGPAKLGFSLAELLPKVVTQTVANFSPKQESKTPLGIDKRRLGFEGEGDTVVSTARRLDEDFAKRMAESPTTPRMNALLSFVTVPVFDILDAFVAGDVTSQGAKLALKATGYDPILEKSLFKLGLTPETATYDNLKQSFADRAQTLLKNGDKKGLEELGQATNYTAKKMSGTGIPQLNKIGKIVEDTARYLTKDIFEIPSITRPLGYEATQGLPGYRKKPGQAPAFGLSTEEIEPVGFNAEKSISDVKKSLVDQQKATNKGYVPVMERVATDIDAVQALREAKGLGPEDIMAKHPDLNLKRDIPVTDIYGNKSIIPEGEALTPYELKGNKVLLQDGQTYIVSKNQYQNIKGQSKSGEAKPFAPELKDTEETVKGRGIIDKISQDKFSKPFMELNEAESLAVKKEYERLGSPDEGDKTKYSQYQLPNGKNYKEVLIKAPTELNPADLKVEFRDNQFFVVDKNGQSVSPKRASGGSLSFKTKAEAQSALEMYTKRFSNPDAFKSSHWDEPNVISHLRLNERTFNGNKVTFMEEMQSDWAREGRSRGFETEITRDSAKQQGFSVDKTETNMGDEAYFINNSTDPYFYRKGFPNTGFGTEAEAWNSLIKKLKETSGDVPNNPLLKNWQELSIKRALKEAVDNNSEYLAWTTGEQQQARYNLSKQVDSISWSGFNDGKLVKIKQTGETRELAFKVNPDGKIDSSIRDNNIPNDWYGKRVDEAIGKGISEKILADKEGNLSGEGLNIGGEWAKNLYDKQVKNIVEDLTGHKVEVIDMGLDVGKQSKEFVYGTGQGLEKLTPQSLEIGMEIRNKGGDAENLVITDVLGDGKFKAVPKEAFDRLGLNMVKGSAGEQTFDISTKKSTGQQAIKITPEIRALVKGEAPMIKKPSGIDILKTTIKNYIKNPKVGLAVEDVTGGLRPDSFRKAQEFKDQSASDLMARLQKEGQFDKKGDLIQNAHNDKLIAELKSLLPKTSQPSDGSNPYGYESTKKGQELKKSPQEQIPSPKSNLTYTESIPQTTLESKFMEDYQIAESQVLADLDLSQAGTRQFTLDGVIASKSTFPQDMPPELRSKSLFDSTVEKLGTQKTLGTKERKLADWIEKKIISRMKPEFADELSVNKFLFGLDEKVAKEENTFLHGLTEDIATGIREKRFSLKEYVKGREITKKIGEREGVKIGVSSQKNIQTNVVEQTKRKGELNLIKEGIKIRAQKDKIIASLKDVFATSGQSRHLVQKLIEDNLPLSERGKFMTMLRDAKNSKDVAKAFFRVDDRLEQITKNNLISEIKKTVDNLPENVDIEYRNKIKEVLSDVELTGHNQNTIKKLEATQKYLLDQKAQGKDVELPERILEKLQILVKTPKEQLTSSQLQGIQDEVNLLKQLGQTKQRVKGNLYQNEKDLIKTDLLDTAKPLSYKELTVTPGQKLPTSTKISNKVKDTFNRLKKSRLALRPIDGIADLTGMEKMKSRFDVDYGNYLDHNNQFLAERDILLEKNNLEKENMERIGIFSAKEQEGGYDKLANLGITQEMADEIVLTPAEQEYYDFGRKWFESDYEAVKSYMYDVYNKDVGKVKNYVSFQTDFKAMSELEIYERFGTLADEGVRRTKTVKKDFTESRTGSGGQKIKLNFDDILLRHKDNVAYMLNLGRDTKMYSEIINTPEMKEKLGDLGTLVWREWLDLMARKGGVDGQKQIATLDMVRRNLGVGVMSFKLSSALIQFSSLADAGATIGGKWTAVGAFDVASSRSARQFVLDNFPEIREMIGDDIAFLELKDSFLGKVGEIGLAPLKKLDGLMRSSTAIGAYKKLAQEKGIPFDMENPDKEIIAEVTKLVRQSQGSSSFKDTPLAITKGMFTGNQSVDKALFQFQSFMLGRWENIERQIWRQGFKTGNYWHGVTSIVWLFIVAGLMEEGLRRGSRKIIDTVTGKETKEDPIITSLVKNSVGNVPIIGNLANSLTYDSNPVPVINAFDKTRKALDTTINGKETATKLKGGIELGLGVANLLGGVPGTTQIGQVVKPLIKTEDDISNQAKAKIRPIYNQIQKLKDEGKTEEADSLYNSEISDEEDPIYQAIKTAEKTKKTNADKIRIQPIYDRIKKLKSQGKEDEATAIYNSEISDEDDKVYQSIKKADQKQENLREIAGENGNIFVRYVKAFSVDPENAFKALLTKEKLGKVEGNLVELQRFYGLEFTDKGGSQEVKKKKMEEIGLSWSQAGDYKLEHIVPVSAGGDTSDSNLVPLTNEEHNFYTPIDILVGNAVKDGKITRNQATNLMTNLKVNKTMTGDEVISRLSNNNQYSVSQNELDSASNYLESVKIKPARETQTFIGRPAKKTIGDLIDQLKDHIPFFETRTGKALRNDALRFYKFSDKAKELFKTATFIEDISPEETLLPGLWKKDNKYSEGQPATPFGGVNIVGQRDNGKKDLIQLNFLRPDSVAHELIHTAFNSDPDLYSNFKSFNQDWETLKTKDRRLGEIDKLITESGLYVDIPDREKANERYAYFGDNVGVGGIKAVPPELRQYYEKLFN